MANRPSKWGAEIQKQIKFLAKKGFTDAEIGKAIGVATRTIGNWKEKHPEFFKQLKGWKDEADEKVERALYERATGFTCKEDKVFCSKDGEVTVVPTEKHYAPDPVSCIFWLKNRQPDKWREKHELGLDKETAKFIFNIGKGK